MQTTLWPVTRLAERHASAFARTSKLPGRVVPEDAATTEHEHVQGAVTPTTRAASVGAQQGKPRCATCPSRGRSVWCTLQGSGLADLERMKSSRTYQTGQSLFYQGSPSLGVYCIASGTIAVRKTDATGNAIIVRLAHAGDTLGYRAFFAGDHLQSSADALEPSQVCFLDKSAVQSLLEHYPLLSQVFLKKLAQDVGQAENAQLLAMTLPVRARLAHLLLVLKDRFGQVDDAGELRIQLPLSRQDMAAVMGTRPETVARAVRSLEEDRIAFFDGRTCRVPDLDALLDALETAG